MKTITAVCCKLAETLRLVANTVAGQDPEASAKVQAILDGVLPRADRVIDDARAVLTARERTFEFRQFLESPFSANRVHCIVTIRRSNVPDKAVVLEWDPNGYKWFIPLPFGERAECGHLTSIGPIQEYGGLSGTVEAVQLIAPDLVLSS